MIKQKYFFLNIITVIVIAVLIGVYFFAFVNQMYRADQKPFWGDESFGLKATVKAHSYTGLILKAARNSEANPAPLDYICVKVLDDLKPHVKGFGLSDETYYRLWANFIMTVSGLFVAFVFIRDILSADNEEGIKILQLILLALLPLSYLFRPLAYHYAAEVRPYASWFSWWFIAVALCLRPQTKKITLCFFLVLLSMTLIGSLFQIAALAMAYFIVSASDAGWKKSLMDTAKVFTLPIALVLFYGLPGSHGNMILASFEEDWTAFWKLWTHEGAVIPMMLLCSALLYIKKESRRLAVGPLAVLLVFLMGPVIFFITRSRLYFFTNRQYIYYDIHRAIFLLAVIKILPSYLKSSRPRLWTKIGIALILVLCFRLCLPKKNISLMKESVGHAILFLTSENPTPESK